MKQTISIVPIIFLLCFYACDQDRNTPPDKHTVARVGETLISDRDFEQSFWLEPHYAIRTSLATAYRSQAGYLIDQEYFYLAANKTEITAEPEMVKRTNYIRQQEILKAFIHESFLDTIRITDQELRTGLGRYSRMLRVLNIFSKDKNEITRHKDQVRKPGVLAMDYFLVNGEDLGWITFGDIDPEIEAAVFVLETGTVSDVITSSYGYHLLLVTENMPNQNYQHLNDRLRLENVQEILRKRRAHRAISTLLQVLAGKQKIGINNPVIHKMADQFIALEDPRPENPQLIVPPLSNGELRRVELQIKDIKNEPLVRLGANEITVAEFLDRLSIMPPFHRPYLKGYNRLQQAAMDMIRNDMLLEAALSQKYAERESVQQNIAKSVREMLSHQFGSRYKSNNFKEQNTEIWQEYDRILVLVKKDNPAQIYEKNLFRNLTNPDSLIVDAPMPIMLKNRYVW